MGRLFPPCFFLIHCGNQRSAMEEKNWYLTRTFVSGFGEYLEEITLPDPDPFFFSVLCMCVLILFSKSFSSFPLQQCSLILAIISYLKAWSELLTCFSVPSGADPIPCQCCYQRDLYKAHIWLYYYWIKNSSMVYCLPNPGPIRYFTI